MTRPGGTLAVDDAGSGDPALLVHGFPELAYSWRHQVPALVAAGYRAITYDQRGYGASFKPEAVEDYRLTELVGDAVAILDALDIERVVLVGHDWGSIVAWSTALFHPERVRAVVSLNVPYRGWCCAFPPIEYLAEHQRDRFGYVISFQEPGAEARLEADVARSLEAMYGRAAADAGYLDSAEMAVYVDAFEAGGFGGPVNYYRNIDRNWRDVRHLENAEIPQPVLVLAADRDPVLPLSLVEGMDRWIPDLRVEVIENCGHWTQQEQPGAVNRAIIGFMDDLGREAS